jgi:small subunit ribosomal protein S16
LTYLSKIGKLNFVVIAYQETFSLLVIRLARTGRAKYPTYRIVAAESARAATGKFIAILGHYNPHTKELVLKQEEISKHLSNGAQPSNTVVKLLTREKIELPSWVKLKTKAAKITELPASKANEVSPAEAEADAAPAIEKSDQRVAEVAEATAGTAEAVAPSSDTTDTAK